jgi:membrane protease YdiL (CAAX protease family)
MPEKMPPHLASRVAVSIVTAVGWLVFLVIFLGFYASGINVYKNLAIILASILVVGAILGSMWAYWGIKYGWKWEQRTRRKPRQRK